MAKTNFTQALATNIIYVFTIDDANHKEMVKVGKASIHVENPSYEEMKAAAKKRIDEYTHTAAISYEIKHLEVAKRIDANGIEHSFMDHEVHDVLKHSGIKNIRFDNGKTEWFKCGVDVAKQAIKAVKEYRYSLNPDEIKPDFVPINFRPEQSDAIEKTLACFLTKNEMLWYAKMRFGKTVSALEVVKRSTNIKKTLIFTHRPVVLKGWYEDYQKIFHGVKNYKFGSRTIGDPIDSLERQARINGTRYIYFASMQDLRGSEQVGGNFDKNDEVFSTEWDLLIVDEAHEGTLTELGENVLNALQKEHTKILRLSGTPFNLLEKYGSDNVYTWDYTMEQRAKRNWEKEHPDEKNPYASLPTMNIYTYDLTKLLNKEEVEDTAFNFREFFRTDGDFDRFIHEDKVKQFLDLLVYNAEGSLYPYSNDRFEHIFRHTLWMIPGVKAARALSILLKQHDTFKKYQIVNVAGEGDEEEASEEALSKVNSAITSHPEKTRTITLSCGRLTTGVSVPAWTGVLMLAGSAKTSAANYMQTIFRVQTPGDIGGRMKEQCFVFDFAPDRTLQVLADVAKIDSVGKGTTDAERQQLGEFINFCPVIAYDGSEMKPHSVDTILTQMKRVFIERVVQSGFDDVHIYNRTQLGNLSDDELKDFDRLHGIIGKTKAAPKSKGIDVTTGGMTDEEYEKATKADKDKKAGKKLTPEEKAALEKLQEKRKQQESAAAILRGISIRMPLLVYGADIKAGEERKVLNIDNFTMLVDDESWKEFMPKGVTKDEFLKFKKYFDPEVFAGASLRIRELTREADKMDIEDRIEQITTVFNYFRNPDKETVLTPWRVVNMHMSDCLGGRCFYDEEFSQQMLVNPRTVDQGEVTTKVFAPDAKILEINSKSGLYPLYMAYNIYYNKYKQANKSLSLEEQQQIWDTVISDNIFVLCMTPMAAAITRRTLRGFRRAVVNAKYYPNLLNSIKTNTNKVKSDISKGKTFWGTNNNDNMKFTAIVGNPPYQLMGGSGGNNDAPIYQNFASLAMDVHPCYISLIMPSRWFAAGRENLLGEFRNRMLNCGHIVELYNYNNGTEIFKNVEIKGGICYYLYEGNYNGACHYTLMDNGNRTSEMVKLNAFDVLIRNPFIQKIVEKVEAFDMPSRGKVSEIISSDTPFGIPSNPKDSKKTPFPVYATSTEKHNILLFHIENQKRKVEYVCKEDIKKNAKDIDSFKVFIPGAGGSGNDAVVLGTPEYAPKGSVCSQSYLYAAFPTETQSKNFMKYLKTKFLRILVSSIKITQSASNRVYRFVPLQDFTSSSDIDWSKPIADIDRQLYAKYHLASAEIAFIEKMIKPME